MTQGVARFGCKYRDGVVVGYVISAVNNQRYLDRKAFSITAESV